MPERLQSMLRAPQPLLWLGDGRLWDGSQTHPSMQAWCAEHGGQRCELLVSACGLHELVCDADLPLADDAAALEWARALLQHYHGEAAQPWALASWQTGSLRGVSVLHGLDLAQLQHTARGHGVRLRAVRPWWAAVLPLALRRQPGLRLGAARLLVVEGGCVVCIDLQDGALSALTLRRLDNASTDALHDWLLEQPPRETVALGYGLQGPQPLAERFEALDTLDALAPARHWLQGGRL